MSNVDDSIQARIQAAAARRERLRQERAELAENRAHGLKARKRAKLRRYRPDDTDGAA